MLVFSTEYTCFFQIPTGVEFGGVGLMRCVTSSLTSHAGRVVTAQCSPHHRNAVLSAGSDNQIRLYTLLQVNEDSKVLEFAPGSFLK